MDNKKIKGKLDEKQDMLRRLAMPDVMQEDGAAETQEGTAEATAEAEGEAEAEAEAGVGGAQVWEVRKASSGNNRLVGGRGASA